MSDFFKTIKYPEAKGLPVLANGGLLQKTTTTKKKGGGERH